MFRATSTLLVFALLLAGPASADKSSELCNFAKSAISDASKIRGLKQKRPVPCFVHTRDQVREYLLETIETKIPAQKLEMEAVVYKAIGVIPRTFSYKDGIIELYLSQIGGYYDPEKKHFIMAGWMPAMLQTTVAVHELTHALQDQYFDLETYIDSANMSTDQLFARSAVAEGDATAVMSDHPRMLMGQKPLASEPSVQNLMLQNVIGAGLIGSGNDVPSSLQSMIIFPYTSGLRFVHLQLQQGGYSKVDELFRKPPRSTEEILHPEKYGTAKADFENPPERYLEQAGKLSGDAIYTDILGEFSISALLSSYTPDRREAAAAAAGWGGDRVGVFDTKDGQVVVWVTRWDSKADADQFFDSYRSALEKHYAAQFSGNSAILKLTSGQSKVTLSRSGSEVVMVVNQ